MALPLQEQRLKAGFSQGKLAEASGVPKSIIQKYEIGYRDINGASLETLCKLATTIGCRISDIITDENIKKMLKECSE